MEQIATPAADRTTTAAERLDGWSRGEHRIMASGYGPFSLRFNRDIQEVVEAASMRGFLSRLRCLFSAGAWKALATAEQRMEFIRHPASFILATDDEQAAAIWREIEKRQGEL